MSTYAGERITASNVLRLSALAYAIEAGVEVLPLVPGNKNPLIAKSAGGRGFHDATTDPERIRYWWTRWPDANIGGRIPSDMVVIELDGPAGLEWLRARGYSLAPTTTSASGREGGFHYWVRINPSPPIRAFSRPGVQIKTHDGGYVVMPPSIHPNGKRYRWVTDIPLREAARVGL